jgi:hypothetical protein
MSENSLPIVESADGITLLSNWLIAVREDFSFFESIFRNPFLQDKRAYQLQLTLHHETIHFLQGMTAALPFSYSVNLLNFCNRVMRESREGKLDARGLTRFRAEYKKLNTLLAQQVQNVSIVHILEAMAVVESLRSMSAELSASEFINYVETYYRNSESVYRRVIDIIRTTFNDLTAFESTSRICFLALNGDNPPQSFWTIIQALQTHRKPWQISAIEMARFARIDYRASLLAQHYRVNQRQSTHKVLAPYIDKLSTLGTLEEVFEFAARPSDWLSGNGPEGIDTIMPPLILFSGGRGLTLGLAKQWEKEQLFMFIDAAALVGACQRILVDNIYYLACPHTMCPLYDTQLCHAWFAIPEKFEECAFPKRFKLHFGKPFEDMLKLCEEAAPYNLVDESKISFHRVIGRNVEEYRQLLNSAANLKNPADWDKVVISLLSEAEIAKIEYDLMDNTAYLAVSVSGYLLDMVGEIPRNPFQIWMDDQRRFPTNADIIMIRQMADTMVRRINPWFGLTLLRSLKYICSFNSETQALPAWLEEEIHFYASIIKE